MSPQQVESEVWPQLENSTVADIILFVGSSNTGGRTANILAQRFREALAQGEDRVLMPQ